jgi:hypothetical protein
MFIKSILHSLSSNSICIYCSGFNKKKYNEIKKEINLTKFEEKGNINEISSLGLVIDNKNDILKSILEYSYNKFDINNLIKRMTIEPKDLMKIISNILYDIGLPIKPQYINNKFKIYNKLYEICSENEVLKIYLDTDTNDLKEMVNIFLHNSIETKITEKDNFDSYDMIIIKSYSNITEKLQMLKFIYLEEGTLNDKKFMKIDDNIYKKIK